MLFFESCWQSSIYQPCNEGCYDKDSGGVNIVKSGDTFEVNVSNSNGAVDLFFQKINNLFGFNAAHNISGIPLDVSILYSSDANKGPNVYFESLIRSYECCVTDPDQEILFTAPCINDPVYKLIKICNDCDEPLQVSGYSFNVCDPTCPDGYTFNFLTGTCEKCVQIPATPPTLPLYFELTPPDRQNCYFGANFYDNINTYSLPIINNGSDITNNLIDGGGLVLSAGTNVISNFWGDGTAYPTRTGRLNSIGIWLENHNIPPIVPPYNTWVGFNECINIPFDGDYFIGFGGDDYIKISIDDDLLFVLSGQSIPTPPNINDGNWNYWHVFTISLSGGTHQLNVQGYNVYKLASIGLEIYSATTLPTLTAATNPWETGIVWTTWLLSGTTVTEAGTSGYTCPDGYTFTNCSGTPVCTYCDDFPLNACDDHWDIRFLHYSGDCHYRELIEFDPWNNNIQFSGNCDSGIYPYSECKCFYVAVGYRSSDINDHYNTLNIFLSDSGNTINTLSYDLHGRASISYPALNGALAIFGGGATADSPLDDICPIKPSCDCLNIVESGNLNSHDGYPTSQNGVPYYEFEKIYTIQNLCYTEFNLQYLSITPIYSGLTIDISGFNGILGKNEIATLTLNYSSSAQTNLTGIIAYNATTNDPFSCEDLDINCASTLNFDFTAKPIPLIISNSQYNFGGVGNGCCSNATFNIQNTGSVTMTIIDLALTNPLFQIVDPTLPLETQEQINPFGVLQLTIDFCPTGCTDGTIHTTDLLITTSEYGVVLGSSLSGGFTVSGTCVNPPITASTDSLVFIKHVDEALVSGLTICNRTNVIQNVDMSNCIQFISGTTTETVDPLNYGFEIIIDSENTVQNSITYPRTLAINPYECRSLDIRYDINQPDRTFCSIYLRDNCDNVYEIPFTGYSLPYPIEITNVITVNPVCYGDANGSVSISFSGGAAPYRYTFSGNGVNQAGTIYGNSITFNNLTAIESGTDYQFALSGNPCNGTLNIPDLSPFITTTSPEVILGTPVITTLTQPAYLQITATAYTGKTCVQLASASVTITGGTTPYIFNWSNGGVFTGLTTPYTNVITGLNSGTYGVTVRDANGCQKNTSVTIPNLLSITMTPQISSVSCYGGTNGGINVLLGNALAVVSYTWSGYTYDGYSVIPTHTDTYTSTTANNLPAGTYSITYIDGNGCSGTTILNVTQPQPLGFNVSSTDVTCPGYSNGIITFSPITGGTFPYQVWASGATTYSSSTTPTIYNVAAGFYNTYIIDSHGCQTDFKPITINIPEPFNIGYDYTATTCYNSSDGQILLTVTGGTGPYSYMWTPLVGATNHITGLPRGNYNVTILDSNGCSISTGFTLPYTSTYCGDLTVTDINDVPIPNVGGVYMINMAHTCLNTVSDTMVKLCQTSPCAFNVVSYSGISTNINDFYLGSTLNGVSIPSSGCTTMNLVFNPTSAQTYNGFFTITTEYCTYYFSLSGTGVENILSANTQFVDFSNVCFGTADTKYVTVVNLTPDDRSLSIQTTPAEMSSINTLTLLGNSSAVIPYTFTPTYPLTYPVIWQREFTGTTKITNCPTLEIGLSGTGYGGNLYVSNLDFGCVNRNCYRDQVATIYNYHCLPVTISSVNIAGPYSNALQVLTSTPFTIPAGGTAPVTVRYSALTSVATAMLIQTNFSLAATIMSGITACMVDTLGTIPGVNPIITVPGTPMNSYVDITNITHTTLFINANITNNSGATPTNLTVAPALVILPAPVLPITGTSATFTITFNDPNAINEWFNLNLSDNCGNHVSLPFYVESAAVGYKDLTIVPPLCYGSNNGSISLTPTGGTSSYTVVWDNGITGTTNSNLTAGTYNMIISDYYGHSNPFSFVITEPDPLGVNHTIPFNGYVNILVYSGNTGYINLNVSGGTIPYTYEWSGYTYQNLPFVSYDANLSGITAGQYFVTITDNHNCSITDFVLLTQPDPLSIVITNCTPPVPPEVSCSITGGSANITVSGGQGPYSIIVCPTDPQNPLFDVGGPYYGLTDCQILPNCSDVPSGTTCVSQICYCCDQTLAPCLSAACPITLCDVVINELPPGNYPPGSFGVTDANSGSTSYIVPAFVPNPSTLGFELTQTPATCGGQSNGSITTTIIPTQNQLGVFGMGIPPYVYYLNGVQQGLPTTNITQTFTGLTPNYYNVMVIDSDSNTVSHTIYVSQGRLTAIISTTPENATANDGSITINQIIGGVGPYNATINSIGPVTIYDGYVFNHLSVGSYLIEIIDSLGCRFTIKPVISRVVPFEEGQRLIKTKTPIMNPTIYEKRLGGFKLIKK